MPIKSIDGSDVKFKLLRSNFTALIDELTAIKTPPPLETFNVSYFLSERKIR